VLPSVTDAEPDEAVPVGWAFLYFSVSSAATTFCVPFAMRWRSRAGWFLARQEEKLKLSRTEVNLPPSKATN